MNKQNKYYIFSYGTLSDPVFQNKVFKHDLKMTNTALEGFAVFKDTTPYFGLIKKANSTIYGKLIEVSHKELEICDLWEEYPNYYTRHLIEIKSKDKNLKKAFIYNKKPVGEFQIIDSRNYISSKNKKQYLKDIDDFILNKIKKLN